MSNSSTNLGGPSAGPAAGGEGGAGSAGSQIGLKSGTKLGKYEIVGRLGLGGMALVYKGYDPLLDRFVAVKQIASHLAADPKFMDRFRKEAQILARLGTDQASVVQIYELIEDARGLFIIMEYVEGQTLDVLMSRQQGPMPTQATLEIIWHLAVGLRAVHERGIIHRDIKPANVLVGVNRKCKITDFGVAARHGGKTSMTLGTTKYMAPELFGGEDIDGRCDIYSLGCITYEMLVGPEKFQQIFHEVLRDPQAEALRWMKWHTNRELMAPMLNQVNPHVPEVLAKIVAKMMAKDPAQRFTSAEHLLEILKRHFTQQGQARKATDKKARAAAAVAAGGATAGGAGGGGPALPGDRKLEPIPDRSAGAPSGPVPVAAVAPGATGPLTSRLPKRKMTRKQRIVTLSIVAGVVTLATFGLLFSQYVKTEQHKNLGEQIYAAAVRTLDKDPALAARGFDKLLKAEFADLPDVQKLAQGQLVVLKAQQSLAKAYAASLEVWPPEVRKRTGEFASMKESDLRATTQQDWDAADADRQKALANRAAPADRLNPYQDEFNNQHDFMALVDQAQRNIDEGLATLSFDPIDQAVENLKDAKAIYKGESLEPWTEYLAKMRAECQYRQLVKRGIDAEKAGNVALAQSIYEKALTVRPNDKDVQNRLARFVSEKDRADRRKRADDAWALAGTTPAKTMEARNELERYLRQLDATSAEYKEIADKIRRLEGRDAYMHGLEAYNGKQYSQAEGWFREVEKKVPDNSAMMAEIANYRTKMKNLNEVDTLHSMADQAMGRNDTKDTLAKLRAWLAKEPDPTVREKINENIRQINLKDAMQKANDAMAAGVWAEAKLNYREALNFLKADDAAIKDEVKSKLDEIDVREAYRKMLADGDKAFKDANYDQARVQFKALKKYSQDLQAVLDGGVPAAQPPRRGRAGPAPADPAAGAPLPKVAKKLIDEIRITADARLKEVDFATFMLSARGEIDRQQWPTANAWLKRALDIKPDDPTAKDLLKMVEGKLQEEKPGG